MKIEAGNLGLYYGTSPELPGSLIMGKSSGEVRSRLAAALALFQDMEMAELTFLIDTEAVEGHRLECYGGAMALVPITSGLVYAQRGECEGKISAMRMLLLEEAA